jgi:hypothetical protein
MKRWIWLWVFLLGGTGCALPVRTQGITGPVSWSTTAFNLKTVRSLDGVRSRFSFTLTLQETQGRALTLNAITWEVWQQGVDLSGRQTRRGPWELPAHGTLQQPFVYRIYCPPVDYCPHVGPTTQWDVVFEGTDAQGQDVRLTVQAELPWIPPKAVTATPDREPLVKLPPIDVSVPRKYYPISRGE